jgi:hypothetical protein
VIRGRELLAGGLRERAPEVEAADPRAADRNHCEESAHARMPALADRRLAAPLDPDQLVGRPRRRL